MQYADYGGFALCSFQQLNKNSKAKIHVPYRWPDLLFSLDSHLRGLMSDEDLPHHIPRQNWSLGFSSED